MTTHEEYQKCSDELQAHIRNQFGMDGPETLAEPMSSEQREEIRSVLFDMVDSLLGICDSEVRLELHKHVHQAEDGSFVSDGSHLLLVVKHPPVTVLAAAEAQPEVCTTTA